MNKYALVIAAKSMHAADGNSMMVTEGEEFLVVKSDYGPTTSPFRFYSHGDAPTTLLSFNSPEDALAWGRSWDSPHPWWIRPKSFRVIKISPVFVQQQTGWKIMR